MRRYTTLLLSVVLIAACATPAPPPAQTAPSSATNMSPEQAMEAWMRVASPGPEHKVLDALIGTWNADVKVWMEPGAPPSESRGVSKHRWVLDGRYVEQDYEGTFMGENFRGIGYTGYDRARKQYVGTWMDSMSTWTMVSTGNAEKNGKVLRFTGSSPDPMSGRSIKHEDVITIVSDDHIAQEMWMEGPDGKMHKGMEIHYRRAK